MCATSMRYLYFVNLKGVTMNLPVRFTCGDGVYKDRSDFGLRASCLESRYCDAWRCRLELELVRYSYLEVS